MPKGMKGFQKGNQLWKHPNSVKYQFQKCKKSEEFIRKQINGINNYLKENSKEKERRQKMVLEIGINTRFKKGHAPWNKNKPFLQMRGENCTSKRIEVREKLRIARLNQILPTKDTSIEILLQNKLKEHGIPFSIHKKILNLTQPDIFIEPNICIFADGCFWHSCEKCFDKNYFNKPSPLFNKIRLRKVSDILITQKLINEGYIVLRFWEHEINNDLDNCINKIKDVLLLWH